MQTEFCFDWKRCLAGDAVFVILDIEPDTEALHMFARHAAIAISAEKVIACNNCLQFS